MMRVCDYIVSRLKREGVKVVFGYTGGNIVYCIDAVQRAEGIDFVENRHEQDSAFAADGAAALTGGMSCVMVSSGPGALNLMTGIADAWFDSLPVLFIAGDVSRYQGKNRARQDAFQAAPIVRAAAPFCKFAAEVRSRDGVKTVIDRAFRELFRGRPGPVLLSIAHFVQRSDWIDEQETAEEASPPEHSEAEKATAVPDAAKILSMLAASRAPLLLAGGGMRRGAEALNRVLERKNLPVVASLAGISLPDHRHPFFMGMIGDYGHEAANTALASCDCLIVLGSRLDERQVWALKKYNPSCPVIHADIDPGELFEPSPSYLPLEADAETLLRLLDEAEWNADALAAWRENLLRLKRELPRFTEDRLLHGVLSRIGESMPEDAVFFADVGMNQMVAAQALTLRPGQRLFFSAGLGSMGYAVPAAVGAAAVIRASGGDAPVTAITGDGGFQMSLNELATIRHEGLPIRIIVVNNHCLGMIRGLQDHILEGRLTASTEGYSVCDIGKVADAFGMKYRRTVLPADMPAIRAFLLGGEEAAVLEIDCSYEDALPFPNGPCELKVTGA